MDELLRKARRAKQLFELAIAFAYEEVTRENYKQTTDISYMNVKEGCFCATLGEMKPSYLPFRMDRN